MNKLIAFNFRAFLLAIINVVASESVGNYLHLYCSLKNPQIEHVLQNSGEPVLIRLSLSGASRKNNCTLVIKTDRHALKIGLSRISCRIWYINTDKRMYCKKLVIMGIFYPRLLFIRIIYFTQYNTGKIRY